MYLLYVDFNAKRMSPDTERLIVKYIEQVIPQYSQLNLSWFGGEPVTCLDTVLRISKVVKQAALKQQVKLNNLISTNGYLLGLENASSLFNAGVNYFHITIDGASYYHNRLRVLSDGCPRQARKPFRFAQKGHLG